jgi:hypothetical protein
MYKGLLVDRSLINKDPHFQEGCGFCHQGNEKGQTKEAAHTGLVTRPSDNLEICENCHEPITKTYRTALHYTSSGQKHGVSPRFSDQERKVFGEKVFEKSCRSCHAACGDCHVKGPIVSGISIGLIKGHKFVKKDEGKTCAFCHGGRVYPEFTGEYGGTPDIHYEKGMICLDCHSMKEAHGDGRPVQSRRDLHDKPQCITCHKIGQEKTEKAKSAHTAHQGKLSCQACHSAAPYRNCYACHLDKGATSRPDFILGLNPRDKKTVTTLRLVPTVKETFLSAGIKTDRFDALPNYWDTVPHNIRKRTERTRSCEVCHTEKRGFLTRETLIKGGSKANESLLYTIKPLKK